VKQADLAGPAHSGVTGCPRCSGVTGCPRAGCPRDDDILAFPIYLVKDEIAQEQIGLYEIFQADLPGATDADGDLDLSQFGEPLLYAHYLIKAKESNKTKKLNKKQKEILQEERLEDNKGKKDYSPLPPNQTKEAALLEKAEYVQLKKSLKKSWIQQFMQNPYYAIVENEGKGDCLFAAIRDGLARVQKKFSVGELRKILADNASVDIYQNFRLMYESALKNDGLLTKELAILTAENNALKQQLLVSKDRHQQAAIIAQAEEVGRRYAEVKIDKKQALAFLHEFKFMKPILSLAHFKTALQTCEFWGETWAISTLERVLKIKLVLFSEFIFKAGDIENVLQCGQLNDETLAQSGTFSPSHYVLLNHQGGHYQLITYKDRGAFTYKELPYDIKMLIRNKCLEKMAGPYALIPEFQALVLVVP
jgi:hypothetical protein